MSGVVRLLGTPSSGEHEIRVALHNAHAFGSRFATPARLKRRFAPHTSVADITTALATAEGAGDVHDDGSGNYQLTAQGLAKARSHGYSRYAYVA